jgi:CzcA family heavy metal efflux pump
VLSVQKAPGTNTILLTKEIDRKLDQIANAMPQGMTVDRHVMRQSDFINRSINKVTEVGRDAAIIVAIIVALFLLNVRATIITLVTIPLSVAMALLFLWATGGSINVMTLGGLAIAIGEVVDDSIIDVENVFRRLRENSLLPTHEQHSVVAVIFHASNEIRSSIVFATIIIVMVFVPLLFLGGLEGRFFRPLGVMYITSILASLLVALTVTPALCKFLFRRGIGGSKKHEDGILVRYLQAGYEPLLRFAVRWRKAVIGGSIGLAIAFLMLASTFGTSFLPEFNEGTFTVFLMAPPGTSLSESNRLAEGVDRGLSEIEGVRAVVRRTGRAERDEHAEPVSSSEIEVTLEPGYEKHAVKAEIDRVLGAVPGITTMIGQPIEHRMSHVMSGTPAAVAINVFGEDLNVLRQIAKEIEVSLETVPGARDVNAQREVMITTLPIIYRPRDLSRWGLTPVDAAEQVKTAIFGDVVAQVNQGIRSYDIVVRLAPDQRETVDHVKGLLLRGQGGAVVRLDEVADVGFQRASNLIARANSQRKAVISVNVAEGYNLGHLVQNIEEKVGPIVQKHGYEVEYGGQFEAQQSASRTIYLMGTGVAVMMFMLLSMALQSTRSAIVVMANLPLALIGGIAAIFISESDSLIGNIFALSGLVGRYQAPVISVASMVGFITLFGIAVRNGILLVNHYRHLMEEEGRSVDEAILLGCEQRLVPILMTALTAALGLIPLAISMGEPGSELLAPLAIVVLGGLITSTFLNLVVVPAGYSIMFGGSTRLPTSAEIQERSVVDSPDTQPIDTHQGDGESPPENKTEETEE